MSQFQKIVQGNEQKTLDTLTKVNGEETKPGAETTCIANGNLSSKTAFFSVV